MKQDVSQMCNTLDTRRILDVVKMLPECRGQESAALRKMVIEWWEMKFTTTIASAVQPTTMPIAQEAPNDRNMDL